MLLLRHLNRPSRDIVKPRHGCPGYRSFGLMRSVRMTFQPQLHRDLSDTARFDDESVSGMPFEIGMSHLEKSFMS